MLTPDERQKLIEQLKRHEGSNKDEAGFHLAYRCSAGALTIGYGHNLDANPVPGITAASRLDEDQASRLLDLDVRDAEGQLLRRIPFSLSLDQVRFAALVNMAFNLGIDGLIGFKNTLADVERGNYSGAADRMLQSRWAGQVGYRALELAKQMRTGEWGGGS